MSKKRVSPNATSKISSQTRGVHGAEHSQAWEFSHHLVPPMTASTTFRLQSLERGAQGFNTFGSSEKHDPIWIYDRLEEPTNLMLEEQLASMENGECAISFASGMGAIASTMMSVLSSGDRVLAHRTLYGCTYSLLTTWLPRFGIQTELMNINDLSDSKFLENSNVRVIYFETISNPSLEIIDLDKIVKLVKKVNLKRKKENKILIIVDNTFATPWALRPLEWGVDIVIQSLTKNIAGFGTEMGGAVITRKEFQSSLKLARKDFGAIIHPYSAWHILVYGITTQSLRFMKQQESAQKIAQFLEKHPAVESVVYPGLKSHPQYKLAKKYLKSESSEFSPGTMISFTLKGPMKVCQKFVDDIAKNSYAITLAVSLGQVKTLIEVPGFMTHSGIPADKRSESQIDPRMIRLSIGIEAADDLINDLKASLTKLTRS